MRDVRCIVLAWRVGYTGCHRTGKRVLVDCKVVARYDKIGIDVMDVVHLRRMGYGVIIL